MTDGFWLTLNFRICAHRLLAVCPRDGRDEHVHRHLPGYQHHAYHIGHAKHDVECRNADWVPDPCRGESCVSFLLAEPGYVLAYPECWSLCS